MTSPALSTLPSMPKGLSFTPEDVLVLGHRHNVFRSVEGTRAILSIHGCESSYEGADLPQPQLNALCFAFVAALGGDNHPSLLASKPQLQALFSTFDRQPVPVKTFYRTVTETEPGTAAPDPVPEGGIFS